MRVGSCLLAIFALASLAQAAEATRPPNVVVLFADDLTCQAISCYGDERKLLATPHMDRVAREGMRFDRCLVTNSICGPSRACLLTGAYSHRNGFYNNTNCEFDGSQTTFPKLLQAAGWQTAMIGKWHLGSDPTGFDHWHVLPGQGQYYNPPMIRDGKKVKHEGYVTDLISDFSVEWIKNRDKSKPFLLMTQHKAPHREWSPPLRHLGWNAGKPFAEPPTLFENLSNRPKAVADHDMGIDRTMTPLDMKLKTPGGMNAEQRRQWEAFYDKANADYRANPPTGDDLVRWRYQRYMHDYLGCVKGVDEAVGKLLDALEAEGIAEETMVIVTSDQGFFLGEHGWFDKRWIFEESLRTPMLVRWPGKVRAGSTCDPIASLIDLAPTILEAAGLPIPESVQGRSLVSLLQGERPADWRTSLYYHYYEYPSPHHVRPHRGVVTARHKLVQYYLPGEPDEWELFDREVDPQETRSFHADPAYAETLATLKGELARLRSELGDEADPPRKAFGEEAFGE